MVQIEHGEWLATPKPVHADHLISAIGDVHGRSELLEPLLEALAEDVRRPGVEHATHIFLGDVIDRGDDVLGSLGLVAGGLGAFVGPGADVRDVALMGNHDRWLAQALADEPPVEEMELWRTNGADATLEAFGLSPSLPPDRYATALKRAVPTS